MTLMRLDWEQKIDGQRITSTSVFSAALKSGGVKHANVNSAFVAARHLIGKYPSRWW
jgi:hypothetical protein